MTLRTGKGGKYRYYTCATKARQGVTGCQAGTIPMEKLDGQVVRHMVTHLLVPDRLQEILSVMLARRQDRAQQRRAHVAELSKRAADADLRLKRLYESIESGLVDAEEAALKERIAGL